LPKKQKSAKQTIKQKMQNFITHAKLSMYARQIYLTEVTRGIVFVLLIDLVVAILIKRMVRKSQSLVDVASTAQRHVTQRI
jgi:hypothetical protein